MIDISYSDALQNLRQIAPLGRSILKMEEVLAKASAGEQYLTEIQARIDTATAEEKRVLQYVADAHQAATDADAKAEALVANARSQADAITADARAEAARILAQAKADADNAAVVAAAQLATVNAQVDAVSKQLADSIAARDAAQVKLDAIHAAINAFGQIKA